MEQFLRNKNVLVFGGGSGIGKAIAQRLLEAGATVLIAGRNEKKLQEVAEELGERAFCLPFDITDVNGQRAFFEKAQEKMGGLSAFVNSSGMASSAFGRGYEPWDITSEEWDTINDVDYKAAFFLLRNEVDYLLEKGIHGNILTLASNAPFMDVTGAYGASKLAIVRWTRAFGKRYAHNGIIINGIAPGSTYTPMIADGFQSEDEPFPRHGIERLIKAEEIGELAYYLMSNVGEIVCGHTVIADGGDNVAH